MADECEYDALTQNTLTATFSPEHIQVDTKDGEEDEEALDESMSPYLASTQSTSDASQCPRYMGSLVGSAQEEKLVAVQTPTARPLCDTCKFEVTPNNLASTSPLGAAKLHRAIASQTLASWPLRQEAGGTVGTDEEESRHASPLLPAVYPPSGVRSNDCTGKQLVPREGTAAISTSGSFSHITHEPASGTAGKLRGSEHSPTSLRSNRGVETSFRAARHICLGKHGTGEGGAIERAGGPGRSRGNYLLGPMGHSTSTKVPKPIKDIVAESLKAMLDRDDRERLKREGLRFVKGGTISTAAGLQPTPRKDTAPLLRHTGQESSKKASQTLVMRHAGELSGSRGILDIGEGVGFESGDGNGGRSATPGADSASPSPVEGVERALEEAGKDGPNAPGSLSGRVKNGAPARKVEPVSSRVVESQGASNRRLIRTTTEWEKHTKGFGSRILKSMGFDSATGEPHQIDSVLAFVSKQMARRRGSREGIGYESSSATLMAPCEVDPLRVRSTHSYYRVPVAFPFEAPMTAQDQMMQRVLAALTMKRHGMFESPTGTGKSQALLCSVLAFQRWAALNTGRAPKIFYCVRTHTQQNQMIKELEKSPYRPTHAALASRTQLCVNPMVVGDGLDSDDDEGESAKDVGGGGARPNVGSTDMQRGRRRSRPNRHSMQQSCEALRSKVNRQRLNKFLKQPDGGRVPYDDSMPDLRMDRAGIAGRLSTDDMVHVGCPHWRMMSSPAYAELLHEYARPKPGLVEGDGVHDLSDDRAFGRDPKGFLERKREARRRGHAGCGTGSSGGCSGGRRCHGAGSNNSSTASAQDPSEGARTSLQASPVSSSSQAAVIDLSYESSGSDAADGVGGEGSWNGLGRCRAQVAADSEPASPSQTSGADPMLYVQTSAREQRFGERPRDKGLKESLENVGGREGPSTAQGGSSSVETRDSREAEGAELIGCPMYANQVLAQQAQLVIVTYNYVLDPNIRSAMLLSLQDAVVVIDEAHNVEGVCRDAGSVELSTVDMANIALDLCFLGQRTRYSPMALVLLGFMLDLLRLAARESGNLRDFEAGTSFDDPLGQLEGEEVTEKTWAHDSAGINFWRDLTGGRSPASHSSLVAAMSQIKEEMKNDSDEGGADRPARMTPALNSLDKFLFVTDLVLKHPHDYNVNVSAWHNVKMETLPVHTQRPHARCPLQGSPFVRGGAVPKRMFKLNLWLMAPSVIFEGVASETHSVILTSGTLSPLRSLEAELGRSFSKRLLPPALALEAKHVINTEEQVRVIPVGYSPRNYVLRCTESRRSNEFLRRLGRTIARLCQHVPSGVLVFLPSYATLRRVGTIWRACDVWRRLERIKGIIVEEPESGAEFKAARRRYEAAIDAPGGGSALLLAVYRGKMSEGVSFNDRYARGVLCVGIPFSNKGCPKINAKMLFNDWKRSSSGSGDASRTWAEICTAGKLVVGEDGRSGFWSAGAGVERVTAEEALEAGRRLLSGQEWYTQDAFRALNQAIGRCIRHLNDYGVICLIDERFLNGRQSHNLAKWVRDLPRDFTRLSEMGDTMDKFFKSAPDFVQTKQKAAGRARREVAEEKRRCATALATVTATAAVTAAATAATAESVAVVLTPGGVCYRGPDCREERPGTGTISGGIVKGAGEGVPVGDSLRDSEADADVIILTPPAASCCGSLTSTPRAVDPGVPTPDIVRDAPRCSRTESGRSGSARPKTDVAAAVGSSHATCRALIGVNRSRAVDSTKGRRKHDAASEPFRPRCSAAPSDTISSSKGDVLEGTPSARGAQRGTGCRIDDVGGRHNCSSYSDINVLLSREERRCRLDAGGIQEARGTDNALWEQESGAGEDETRDAGVVDGPCNVSTAEVVAKQQRDKADAISTRYDTL